MRNSSRLCRTAGTARFILAACGLLWGHGARAESPAQVFPGKSWQKADPASLGWSDGRLAEAKQFFHTLPPATVLVVDHGRLVVEWGDPALRVKVSSVRKSLISALYGIYQKEGRIDLNRTMASLGIDDDPPLNDTEKQATVRMLLQSRSGVYHGFVGGTPWMRATIPARSSHAPGTFWYYNNWDFNALGTIFEQLTKTPINVAFANRIARPIGMEDFRLEDMRYQRAIPGASDATATRSRHPLYAFALSARDMARFGYLFLRRGNWNGNQIVPAEWITESTRPYSKAGLRSGTDPGGYAYLWWVDGMDLPVKSYSARGAMAKLIVVIPERDLVLVYQNHVESPDDTSNMTEAEYAKLPSATGDQTNRLFRLLVEAQSGGKAKP